VKEVLGHRRALRWLAPAAATLLVVGASVLIWHQRATIAHALMLVRHLPSRTQAGLALLLLGAALAKIVLSGLTLTVLIRRYRRVDAMDMQALVAVATLINYSPFRVGAVSRVAYHRAVHEIPVVDSVKTVAQGLAISALTVAYCAAAGLAARRLGTGLPLLLAAPVPVLLAGVLDRRGRGAWLLAALPRYLEALIVAGRYHVLLGVLGAPITASGALALACISMLSAMVPILGPGPGLREWAVGLLAPLVAGVPVELGLTADLLSRATELLAAAITGSLGTVLLGRRARRTHPSQPARRGDGPAA
jgi:hypothetical protein